MALFINITFGLNYKSSSDENDKEEGTAVLQETPLTAVYKSLWAS